MELVTVATPAAKIRRGALLPADLLGGREAEFAVVSKVVPAAKGFVHVRTSLGLFRFGVKQQVPVIK